MSTVIGKIIINFVSMNGDLDIYFESFLCHLLFSDKRRCRFIYYYCKSNNLISGLLQQIHLCSCGTMSIYC